MLRTRLWMGAILIALASGVLLIDQFLQPWYPFLFIFILALALAACFELLQLLGPPGSGPPGEGEAPAEPGTAARRGARPPPRGRLSSTTRVPAWRWFLAGVGGIGGDRAVASVGGAC